MTIRKVSILFSAVFAIGLVAFAAEEKKFKATCPVSGKPAIADKSADYMEAKVYFCCDKCAAAYASDKDKYTAKANQQLVETEQATQVKCPLSKGKLNPEMSVKVGEVNVQFCCNGCKTKAAEAKGDDQVNLVFSEAAFKKGFEVNKKK